MRTGKKCAEAHRKAVSYQGSALKHRFEHMEVCSTSPQVLCSDFLDSIFYFVEEENRPEPFSKHIKTLLQEIVYSNI